MSGAGRDLNVNGRFRGNYRGKAVNRQGTTGNQQRRSAGSPSANIRPLLSDLSQTEEPSTRTKAEGQGFVSGLECYNCKQKGHLSRNCKQPKSLQQCGGNDKTTTPPIFGFKRLYGFLTKDDSNEVIMGIGKDIPAWADLFQSKLKKSDDFFPLLLHILARKVCIKETILAPNQIGILTNTLNEAFAQKLQKFYASMLMGEMHVRANGGMTIETSRMEILTSVYTIFAFVAWRCPHLARDYVSQLIPGAIGVLSTMNLNPGVGNPVAGLADLLQNYQQLLELIQTEERKKVEASKRFNKFDLTEWEDAALHDMAPPEDFREIPIIPSIEELLSTEEPFLRTNKKAGRYNDANHYLDVQFRLLREDFVSPLRRGTQDFIKNRADYISRRKKPPLGSIRIYQDVSFRNVELIRNRLVYNVQLQLPDYKRIRWGKSKRLLNGSLLVLTSDNFDSAFFAVVAQRDIPNLEKGILGITWEAEIPTDLAKSFLMVESEVYFEAFRHTLGILKKIELHSFPLAKFIVEASDAVSAPEYISQLTNLMLIGPKYISPLVGPWPTASELGFDENQLLAYEAALTKEFSIIQGPPGTGKTYLGLRIAETFLKNLSAWWTDSRGPILVVCYTNHALDQFLEGILRILKEINPREEDPGLIRVGGRSKCEALDEYTLMKKRVMVSRMRQLDNGFRTARNQAISELRSLESNRASLMGEAVSLGNLEGLVQFHLLQCWDVLVKVISPEILRLLENPEWLHLGDLLFTGDKFDPSEVIYKLFRKRLRNQQTKVVSPPAVNDEKLDSEDEEDYDLEELQQNRTDDSKEWWEDKTELRACNSKNGLAVSYINPYSVSFCRSFIEAADEEIKLLIKSKKKPNYQNQAEQVSTLNGKIIIARNRMTFLELLMRVQKKELLELPNMRASIGINSPTPLATSQLRALTTSQRWSIYFDVIETARELATEATKEVEKKLVAAQKNLEAIYRVGDGQILQKTKVVGMTTTGAAKNHDLLQMMKSKIVIVEEAAEVLESHIVTSITENCQQLILIGDHQQLRPSTTVFELSKKYHLDISLFERMLNNNLNCYRLKVQHRMRPEIADLVVGTIYDELENSSNVFDYPDVKGMDKNLFFIDHQKYETAEADCFSKSNKYEAAYLAALCRHLILQGYDATEITVLTTYTGQMFLLKKEINDLPSCKGVHVTVVDNYQGEENKIILLSLVRSNDENNIGFLKTDNRICVAISRAKHGLFIIGNMTNLAARSKTWVKIRSKLAARKEIGNELKLVCEIHGNITEIQNPADFSAKAPEGGCSMICEAVLGCTHMCESVCHTIDLNHIIYKCRKRCLKLCSNNHQCKSKCYVACPPCNFKMEVTLPCQHVLTLLCHEDPTKVTCMVLMKKLKPCGHKEDMACHKDPTKIKCKEVVEKALRCGHIKAVQCHLDPELITCKVPVTKVLPCGHEQDEACHKHPEMINCEKDVEIELPGCHHKVEVKCKDSRKMTQCRHACQIRLECGHSCTKICHVLDDPNHILYQCKKPCARKCGNDHPCPSGHPCFKPCLPCEVKMEKVLSCGTHKSKLLCKVDPASVLCNNPCARRVEGCKHKCLKNCYEECHPCQQTVLKKSPCGHRQYTKCSEQPSQVYCEERVTARYFSACQHEALVPCRLRKTISPKEIMKYCTHPCGYQFEANEKNGCTHRCKGTCSECWQGRLHKKCQEECGKMLVCGHACSYPCSSSCPPCQKECFMKCEHSACKAVCGEPCTDCKEKCTWKCVHKACTKLCGEECDREPCNEPCPKKTKCGHPCIGFCGEPCPPLCRDCNREELTEFILYGNEEDADARFVYLEDCKHTIEVEGLSYYMGMQAEEGLIGAKACPRCKTVIRYSRRYGNIIRSQLKDVQSVKKIAFGKPGVVAERQNKLILDITSGADWIETICNIHPNMKRYFTEKLMKTLPPSVSHPELTLKPKKISEASLQSLEVISTYAKDVSKLYKEANKSLRKKELDSLSRKYGDLFGQLLARNLPLTKTEVENFENEFDRCFDTCEVYKRRAVPQFSNHGTVLPIYERTYNLVNIPRVYSTALKKEVRFHLKELDEKLRTGLGISDRERREILAAINMRSGRWFKCPNGHIYVITECGGAMEEGRCNECGALIGGGHHRLRSDNRLASEMDGAKAPLWPQ